MDQGGEHSGRSVYRVVEACAMMFPPMGFLGSAWNMAAPSTCATTWFVTTTATPNYHEMKRRNMEERTAENAKGTREMPR